MKFKDFINEVDVAQTIIQQNPQTAKTANNFNDPTVIQQAPNSGLAPQSAEVAKSSRSLQQIQNGLSNIFQRLMNKPIWRNSKLKQTFADRITRSHDHAGQAKAILWPIGNEDDI